MWKHRFRVRARSWCHFRPESGFRGRPHGVFLLSRRRLPKRKFYERHGMRNGRTTTTKKAKQTNKNGNWINKLMKGLGERRGERESMKSVARTGIKKQIVSILTHYLFLFLFLFLFSPPLLIVDCSRYFCRQFFIGCEKPLKGRFHVWEFRSLRRVAREGERERQREFNQRERSSEERSKFLRKKNFRTKNQRSQTVMVVFCVRLPHYSCGFQGREWACVCVCVGREERQHRLCGVSPECDNCHIVQ